MYIKVMLGWRAPDPTPPVFRVTAEWTGWWNLRHGRMNAVRNEEEHLVAVTGVRGTDAVPSYNQEQVLALSPSAALMG